MPLTPRDLPRTAAPVLFGLFNVASGVSGLDAARAHVPAYAAATRLMPLASWALSFAALGLFIFAGAVGPRMAQLTAAVAIFWWLLWAAFVAETLGHAGVSLRAVVTSCGIASLHLLLLPYRRSPRLDSGRRCDRT